MGSSNWSELCFRTRKEERLCWLESSDIRIPEQLHLQIAFLIQYRLKPVPCILNMFDYILLCILNRSLPQKVFCFWPVQSLIKQISETSRKAVFNFTCPGVFLLQTVYFL